MFRRPITASTLLIAALTFSAVAPGYSQSAPPGIGGDANGDQSARPGRHVLAVQLTNAVGAAEGKSDQSGVTTMAHIDPQPSAAELPGADGPGTPGNDGRSFSGGTPPRQGGSRWGGLLPNGGGGDGSGKPGPFLGGPPSQNTLPCGTPHWQCFTVPSGSTYFSVPASTFQGVVPFTPAGPWIPTGPVTRLDPVAKAHDLVNHMAWPSITIGINPNPGIVAMASWFWIQNYSGQVLTNSGAISETHQECRTVIVSGTPGLECHNVTNSMTVEARVGPTTYEWNFGDKQPHSDVTYSNPKGLGRAYTDPRTPSPVAWSYEFDSYGYDNGFPVSVAISFMAEFRANGGAWAGLDPVTRTWNGNHVVEQVVPLVVGEGLVQ
jgi:hypothetical protein